MRVFPFSSGRAASHRIASAAAAGLLCFTTATFAAPALSIHHEAAAQGMDDPAVAAMWGLNSNRVGTDSPLNVEMESVTPQTLRPSSKLTVRANIKNTSANTVSNIIVRLQRGEALSSTDQARVVLAEPEGSYATVTGFSRGFTLEPGASRQVEVQVPVGANAPEGLGIKESGVYPLLLNVNGQPEGDIEKLLAETRTLVPVRAAKSTPAPDGDSIAADATDANPVAEQGKTLPSHVPFSMVYPLAERVPVIAGETGEAPRPAELILSDDSLGQSVSPGGRLNSLLRALEQSLDGAGGADLRASTCIAIDPETLDAITRMSDGYLTGSVRPSPVQNATRLRDSWGSGDTPKLTEGKSAEAAKAWLDRLRRLAEDTCVMALPWASANMSSIADSGNPDLAREALASSQQVVAKHLDAPVLPGVFLPTEGYVTEKSAPLFAQAQQFSTIDPSVAYENSKPLGNSPANASILVAANSATKDDGALLAPGESGALDSHTTAFGVSGALSAALAASGSAPATVGYSNVAGRYDFRLDSAPARMQTSVATLYQELYDAAAHSATVGIGDNAAAAEQNGGGEAEASEAERTHAPIVAAPPANWSVSENDAKTWLLAVAKLMKSGTMKPTALADSLRLSATQHHVGGLRPVQFLQDPGAEDSNVSNQLRVNSAAIDAVTHFMANSQNVALTRYEFTRPLRLDLIRSVSIFDRRRIASHAEAERRNAELRDASFAMIRQLQDSVELVAPGGVYTRASGMSPVIVLGRNGLPLPVPAYVRVSSGGVLSKERYDAFLPAKGSVTVQFTPDSEETRDSDKMTMWLENVDQQRISSTVSVSIQSGANIGVVLGLTVVTLAVGGYFAIKRSRQFRK